MALIDWRDLPPIERAIAKHSMLWAFELATWEYNVGLSKSLFKSINPDYDNILPLSDQERRSVSFVIRKDHIENTLDSYEHPAFKINRKDLLA